MKNDTEALDDYIVVSNDYYILDGHHRLVALYNLDREADIKCIVADVDIYELLELAFDYPKTEKEDIEGNELTEDIIPGGVSQGMDIYGIANYHKVDLDDLMKELEMGIKVELEHTFDRKTAEEIALDHLYEDPKYYTHLQKIHKEYGFVGTRILPPAPMGGLDDSELEDVNEGPTRGLYRGKMKFNGTPAEVEVELYGVDNKQRQYLTKVIHVDKRFAGRLPVGSTLPIPAKIFHWNWKKIDTSGQLGEETLNEFAITPLLIKGLIGIITTVGAGLIRAFASIMVNRVIDGAILTYHDIKNIVAPEPYIKFLKGLNKNDKFNKEFIELILSQRKPGAKVLLGSAWENAMTSLPAFVEAFDRFTTQENISKGDKELLLARIQRSMRSSYMSGWRDIHKTLKKKYPELAKDLREEKLNEIHGTRFDAIGYDKDGKQVDIYFPRARFGFEKNIMYAAADRLFKTGISKGNGIKYIEIYYNKHHLGTIRLPRNFTKGKDWDKLPINEIPMADLVKIDQYADTQLNPFDVVLTDKHFFDRLQDPRNKKDISPAELIGFFKRLGKNKKKFVEFLNQYNQIVAKDNRTKINIPFMKQANKVIAKTIMRKDDFKTPSPEYKFEDIHERSSLTGGYGAEPGEPDTAWLTDGSARKIDTARPEYWFKQGGYKQVDFPKADWVRGRRLKDRDEDMTTRKVVYKVKNVKVSTLKPALQPYSVDDWKPIKEKKKKK